MQSTISYNFHRPDGTFTHYHCAATSNNQDWNVDYHCSPYVAPPAIQEDPDANVTDSTTIGQRRKPPPLRFAMPTNRKARMVLIFHAVSRLSSEFTLVQVKKSLARLGYVPNTRLSDDLSTMCIEARYPVSVGAKRWRYCREIE